MSDDDLKLAADSAEFACGDIRDLPALHAELERRGIVIPPLPREICEQFEGHTWTPAGGGLLICARCEAEAWATEVDDGSC